MNAQEAKDPRVLRGKAIADVLDAVNGVIGKPFADLPEATRRRIFDAGQRALALFPGEDRAVVRRGIVSLDAYK